MVIAELRGCRLAIFFSAVLSVGVLQAQETDSVALGQQYYDIGMETYDFTHRKQAKDAFLLALQYDPNNAKAHFMAGKSIMLTVRKEEALPHFLRAIELDPEVDEEVFYYIGMAYHHTYMFEKAIEYYQLHRKKLIRSLDFEKSKQIIEVDRKIFECRNAEIYLSHPVDVEIELLSQNINSEYPDYAPSISSDESVMVFTSRRDDNVNPVIADDHEYYEDIFISTGENGKFGKAKNMGAPINTNFHNASISLSPDGKELFIYSSVNGGDIYESDLQPDGSWSTPSAVEGINSPYLESSVSVTEDLQTIYFSSNRPGGYGGTDLYMAKWDRNQWGEPVNVGSKINTEMDEDGVFISANGGHLYFSSNGHAGMGDLDIYRTEIDPETNDWIKPLNLGYPINSVENDIYFVLSGDEKTAYYSSVGLESVGEQDIYRIDMSNYEPITIAQIIARESAAEPIVKIPDSSLVKFDLTVLDSETRDKLNAEVTLLKESTGTRLVPEEVDSGTYHVEFYASNAERYLVTAGKENYDSFSFPLYVIGKGREEITLAETITLNASRASNVNLINVYFELDSDAPISMQGIHFLELMMKEQPETHVELAGHTDNTGDEQYNKDLSLRRANAVKKYLVNSGISSDRIKTVGYGEERPMATNETLNGRKLNRRTEFRIISNLAEETVKTDK